MSFNGLSVVQDNLKSISGVLLRHALSNHKLQIFDCPLLSAIGGAFVSSVFTPDQLKSSIAVTRLFYYKV